MKNIDIPDSVTTIGYDLDDTLHYFKRASRAAAEAVFAYISGEFGVPITELGASYKGILEKGQSQHFIENKSSREYRSERFGQLLGEYSILPPGQLEHALDIYDSAIARNLKLIEGAEDVLKLSKSAGYTTFVLSEGPFDAQEMTLQRLGIRKYIDVLITSSQEQLSKSGGLFIRALEKTNSAPNSVLYIGDSLQRDIIPALAAGIHVVHLTDNPDGNVPFISKWNELAVELGKKNIINRGLNPTSLDFSP